LPDSGQVTLTTAYGSQIGYFPFIKLRKLQ
jgi:hypothetical protein